jgi:hypothetical protein
VSLGARYWRTRLARWPRERRDRPREAGYTLLVPVPGDLPVFLELALAVLRTQSSTHRVSTIVIPDQMTPAMHDIVTSHRSGWEGPLDLVELPRPERWILPRLKSASRNHGVQFLTGVRAARSSHVILHDADLFLLASTTLDEQYEACRDRGLACLGVSPVWDDWYAAHGRHLAATWELCSEVDWIRSFAPYLHIGHDGELWGERHTFDTTLHPQALTKPDSIAVNEANRSIVHFNYVISTYRLFQRHGPGMLDDRFRLLLIRVFVDLFATDSTAYQLPTMAEMADGMERGVSVCYPAPAKGADEYARFRTQLEGALSGSWASEERRESTRAALAAFDAFYGWAPTKASS